MPKVRFIQGNFEVEAEEGESILEAARRVGAPQGDRCGGVCACSTCHVYVVEGFNNLSEMEDEEFDILDRAFDVRATSRLGCQAEVHGDIVVSISEESVEAYTDEHPEERERVEKLLK